MSNSLKKIYYKRLSVIVFLSVTVVSLIVIKAERYIVLSDLRDKGESIARILATVVLDAALIHDYSTMERYVRDITKEKFVNTVSVYRADGELIAGRPSVKEDRQKGFFISYPVELGNTRFATVEIVFSTERADRISRYTFIAAILTIILFHLIGIFLINLIINRTVINPIRIIEDAIGRFKEGRYDQKITIKEPLEFSRIVESFNDMTDTIRKIIQEIEEKGRLIAIEQSTLSAIINSMADGLFVTDFDGKIIKFNHSAEIITGYKEEEVHNRKCEDVFKTSLCKDACALAHEGETVLNVETALVRKDGKRILVSVSSSVIYDSTGRPVGGVQTFRDITEEKKRQEVLCQTEKLAAVGQLAAGVAHEINTPLGNILGYAKLMSEDGLPSRSKEKLDIIVEQAKRCSEIVKGLLDYARSSPYRTERVDVNSVISRTVEILSFQALKKDVKIHTDFDDIPLIVGDPRSVEQVILNITINALQAIDDNGNIWIRTHGSEKTVIVSIKDDGPGIPEEIRSRIFDPFFTTKPVGEGTGLGLSICAGIISEMKGSIECISEEGKGTEFKIIFPIES